MNEKAAATAPTAPSLTDLVAADLTATPVLHAARAAAELDLAEYLASGPLPLQVLASRANAHAPSLFRLLRALETVGVFKQISPRVFANTPESELLRKETPGSLWNRLCGPVACGLYQAWVEFPNSIRTGRSAFESVHGCTFWQYLSRDPLRESISAAGMGDLQSTQTPAVTAAYDWSRFPVIADIAGGNGSQMVDILNAHPSCQGVLFDQPHVVAQAIWHQRLDRVAGNFFESVPSGPDAYILRSVLHDWTDQDARAILNNVRSAAKPDSRVFVIERIIPDNSEYSFSKWIDLHMLAHLGGQERTSSEYGYLLETAGFEIEAIISTRAGIDLIVSRPRI
jgi:O-methyltransferase domain